MIEVRKNLLTHLTFAGKEVRKGWRWGSGSAVWWKQRRWGRSKTESLLSLLCPSPFSLFWQQMTQSGPKHKWSRSDCNKNRNAARPARCTEWVDGWRSDLHYMENKNLHPAIWLAFLDGIFLVDIFAQWHLLMQLSGPKLWLYFSWWKQNDE